MAPEPLRSVYANLLNALDEMQQSVAYAVRKSVLWEAETTIVNLDTENAALRARVEELEQQVHYLEHKPDVPEIDTLKAQLTTVTQERDEWKDGMLRRDRMIAEVNRQRELVRQRYDDLVVRYQEGEPSWRDKAESLQVQLQARDSEIERLKSEMGYHEAKDVIEQLTDQAKAREATIAELTESMGRQDVLIDEARAIAERMTHKYDASCATIDAMKKDCFEHSQDRARAQMKVNEQRATIADLQEASPKFNWWSPDGFMHEIRALKATIAAARGCNERQASEITELRATIARLMEEKK